MTEVIERIIRDQEGFENNVDTKTSNKANTTTGNKENAMTSNNNNAPTGDNKNTTTGEDENLTSRDKIEKTGDTKNTMTGDNANVTTNDINNEAENEAANAETNKEVWYIKIKPLIDHFHFVAQSLIFNLGTLLAIDKMLISFMGWSLETICVKNKPIGEGYKFFCPCNNEGICCTLHTRWTHGLQEEQKRIQRKSRDK